jgi:predicted transport protein
MQVLSTHSQMTRLDLSEPLSNVEMGFFKNNLGASGYKALESIRDRMLALDISYDKRFKDVFVNYRYSRNFAPDAETQELDKSYKTVPVNIQVPSMIIEATFDENYNGQDAVFIQIDLNGDVIDDYISLIDTSYGELAFIWTFSNDTWSRNSAIIIEASDSLDIDQFFIDPNLLPVKVEEPQFKQLRIGEAVIYVRPKMNKK